MAGGKGLLKLGKKDNPQKHCNEAPVAKKRTKGSQNSKSQEETPQSPRTPLTFEHKTQSPASQQPSAEISVNPRANKHRQSLLETSMNTKEAQAQQPGQCPSLSSREECVRSQTSSSKSSNSKKSPSTSPILGRFNSRTTTDPSVDSQPASGRAGSQERKEPREGNFMHRMKASRQAAQQVAQTYGGKAAKITAKATANTAKALGEKGQKAWGRIITKTKSSKDGLSQQAGYQPYGNNSPMRQKGPAIDVWGISIRDATLKTRIIREKLSEADSTAYWTPAVAFRCLQYLNVHGPQELGLYRLSGSTAVVDELRAEFVNYHDVDLFDNPPNDIHTVTSLLKGYFRSLPDPLLPTEAQQRIYEQIKDLQPEPVKPPQCFLDELSRLPPYNYYMLYSLTAHLSNVNKQSDVNKMNLSNLGMIFCSTLRLDRPCFNWLVANWADCWQGCWTEQKEIEKTDPSILSKKTPMELGLITPVPYSPAQSSGILSGPPSPGLSTLTTSTPTPRSPAVGSTHSSQTNSSTSAHPSPPSEFHEAVESNLPNIEINSSTSPSLKSPLTQSESVNNSVPSTPFTPASFTVGDDQRYMAHSRMKTQIIAEAIPEIPSSFPDAIEERPKPSQTQPEVIKLGPPPLALFKEGQSKPAKPDNPLYSPIGLPDSPRSPNEHTILPPLTPMSPLISNNSSNTAAS